MGRSRNEPETETAADRRSQHGKSVQTASLRFSEALERLGIAKLRPTIPSDGNNLYTLDGRLPEFPFRSQVVSYTLAVNAENSLVQPDEIEALLRHFWQSPIDMADLQATRDPPDGPAMTQYAVVFDKTKAGYSAWVPDLPGCVATGPSLKKAQKLIQGAIEMHIKSLQRHGEPVPEPATRIEYVSGPA